MAITREEWDGFAEEDRWEIYRLTQISEDDLNRVVDLLPCPVHGRCVPYARQRIEQLLRMEEVSRQSIINDGITNKDVAELTRPKSSPLSILGSHSWQAKG